MRISSAFIIAAFAVLADSSAAAAVANGTDLVITQTRTVGNYTLTVWSDAAGASVTNPELDRRCGSNSVTCSGSNKADSTICGNLLNELYDSTTVLANSPRAVCLGQSGNECCVSWSAAVGDLEQEDLWSAADKTYNACYSGTISGYADDVNLQGYCVRQCLSNRPNDC
ncbi:hypothetical protein C8R45DRAFT_838441 [Mycena sanguinolenta]|nr:hypothetical protein C8R45DRAFT_838441 [Mycena sanguinolenta]